MTIEPTFDSLLDELRRVVDQADPIPDAVIRAAKESFVWRTIDADLAALVNDSAAGDTAAAVAVRASGAARLLTFQAPGVEVEVEVGETGRGRRLTGQLVPVSSARVTIRSMTGAVDVVADEFGRFSADAVPAGTVRLEIERDGSTSPVVTSWVSI